MKNNLLKTILTFSISIVAFTLLLFIYYYPVFSGKKLIQNDVIQSQGALQEANEYGKNSKEEILWSNSSFSGMPVWRGYTSNVMMYFHKGMTAVFPVPVYMGLMAFIGFYILLLAFKVNPYVCFVGSAAFTLSSFYLISIEAGHINKVLAMAVMAPVIGGIVMTYRKQYILGPLITIFFLSLHILYAHFQVTYYLLFIIAALAIYETIHAISKKTIKEFATASGILLVSSLIAVAPNISQLWTTEVYSKSTTRGGSELTAKKTDSGGLDFDYAMKWSNGVDEVLTTVIPYYYGGSSNEALSTSSDTYKALMENNVPKQDAKNFIKNIPLYWGDQPFTSGPVYFGASIFFLFILGMFLIKDNFKWWVLGISIFAFLISMGSNFEPLSKFLFYNLPLYNKFRSVTMAVCIPQLLFPLIAAVVVSKIIAQEITMDEFKKALIWSGGITGLILLVGFFKSFSADFVSVNDEQMKQLPEWAMAAIRSDRSSKLFWDSFRSLLQVIILAGFIWAYLKDWTNQTVLIAALSVIVILDLFIVDKRYLNADNFRSTKNLEREAFAMTSADETILQDKDYFRVINVTKSPFNDATTSYYHKSIGGYSAIKLGRYQDLIENQLDKNNMRVLNMLNTRYFIVPDQKTGETLIQRNPFALGNAWTVNNFKIVANADEEMKAMDSINPAQTAYIDKRFEEQVKGFNPTFDSSATITLSSYHPNRLQYKSKFASEQLVVFSEIYYQPGWNAFIDGKPADHFRANYVLRAMRVPAGEHVIDFKFEPEHYFTGEKISFAGSITMVVLLLGGLGYFFYSRKKTETV